MIASEKKNGVKKPNPILTEKLFLSDYDQFVKYRTIPVLFITHILLLIVSSYIIFSESRSFDSFVHHNRAMQSVFFIHKGTEEPSKDFKKTIHLYNLPQLLNHLDKVIDQIFKVNEESLLNIQYDNENELELDIELLDYDLDEDKQVTFDRKLRKGDLIPNPLRRIGSTDIIKKWLMIMKTMNIELKYNVSISQYEQHAIVSLNYDFTSRGIIKYDVTINYSSQSFKSIDFSDYHMILITIQVVIALMEIIVILYKIYFNLNVMNTIKSRLKTKQKDDDDEDLVDAPVINDTESSQKNSNAWANVNLKDKLKFIPKWYIVFILGALCQIMTGLSYITFGQMTPQTIRFFGFSSMFSWLALGYYFQGHIKYSYIYDTLAFTLNMYSKLLVVFMILFIGMAHLHLTLFPSSIHWFNGLHNSIATLAAEVFGDGYLIIWSSTIDKFTIKTVIFAWVIYVLFTGCHLRVMFVMTEEAFQRVSIQKKFDWVSNTKISVEDYIKHELAYHGEDEEEEVTDTNLFFDDIWIKAIVEKDDVNKILEFDVKKLNDKLYNVKQIKNYFFRKAKKVKKKAISTEIMSEILSDSVVNKDLKQYESFGKTETILMCEAHQGIERLFEKLNEYLSIIVKNGFTPQEENDKEVFINSLKKRIKLLKVKLRQ